jgi:hypothetical protein
MTGELREHLLERCMTMPYVSQYLAFFKTMLLIILWADNKELHPALAHSALHAYATQERTLETAH